MEKNSFYIVVGFLVLTNVGTIWAMFAASHKVNNKISEFMGEMRATVMGIKQDIVNQSQSLSKAGTAQLEFMRELTEIKIMNKGFEKDINEAHRKIREFHQVQ